MQRLLISAVAIGALAASSQAQCFEQNFGVLAPLTGATAGFGDDVAFALASLFPSPPHVAVVVRHRAKHAARGLRGVLAEV